MGRVENASEWLLQTQINDWRESVGETLGNSQSTTNTGVEKASWVAPSAGKFKLNVGASVFAGISSSSVGTILRDHEGKFIQARNTRCAGQVPVFKAKAWGVLDELKWLQTLQVTNVEIECDSTLTVSTLKNKTQYWTEVVLLYS